MTEISEETAPFLFSAVARKRTRSMANDPRALRGEHPAVVALAPVLVADLEGRRLPPALPGGQPGTRQPTGEGTTVPADQVREAMPRAPTAEAKSPDRVM